MKLKIPILLFIVFFKLLCTNVSAQDSTNQRVLAGLCDIGGGGFTVDKTEGCAPLTININNTVPNPIAIGYNAAYDGKSTTPPLQEVAVYTYQNPGTFTLLQQVAVSTGKVYACQKMTIYETKTIGASYSSCGGGKVIVTLLNNTVLQAYDQVEIQWGDGQTDTWQKGSSLVIEHDYADANTSPIVRFTGLYTGGKACDKGSTASMPISFQQAQLNTIEIKSVEMRGDGTLRVTYTGALGILTEIKYSTGGNYVVDGSRSSGGLQPYDIKNLNVAQVYQLKLSSADLCQGQRDSKVISSMTLTGTSNNGENQLTWSQYPDADGFAGYDLLRDGTLIKSFTSISDITYTDKDVQCGSYSEYQVIARIKDVTSISAPVGVKTEITSPSPIQEASVSVLGSAVVLIKANVPGSGGNGSYSLTIERADAGTTAYKKIITLYNQNEYSDIDVKTNDVSYCYRLSYENSCGQKLPASESVCTILLKKNLTTLQWTPELPILGGIEGYDVSQTGSSGGETIIPVQMMTQYTIKLNAQSDLEYNFMIRATSPGGEFESLSNIVNYRRNAGVFLPDAFTPNGDGFNDVLEAKSTQLQSFNLSILNRWGQVVFYSDDITKSWDGTINGTNAPVGSYVYKMTFVDDINQTVEKNGTFMLLR